MKLTSPLKRLIMSLIDETLQLWKCSWVCPSIPRFIRGWKHWACPSQKGENGVRLFSIQSIFIFIFIFIFLRKKHKSEKNVYFEIDRKNEMTKFLENFNFEINSQKILFIVWSSKISFNCWRHSSYIRH
jgi:hypothetical protein